MAKDTSWAKGRRRLKAAKGRGRHGRQRPPRNKGRHRPWLTKGISHEKKVATGQREGMAVGTKRPRALVSSHGQRYQHNLAHDSSHDPARDPAHDLARDPAKGG